MDLPGTIAFLHWNFQIYYQMNLQPKTELLLILKNLQKKLTHLFVAMLMLMKF